MPRAEISWKRRTPAGETIRVYAQHFGDQWRFFVREARYEQRQPIEHPPLDDWRELLDAVCRRVGRGLLRPEEIARVKEAIHARFPDAEL